MGEPTQIMFKFTEIAELLVKKQGLHEGLWAITIRFGLNATNIPGPTGDLLPTAILPVVEMGLIKFEKPNSLTVDAAKVNPAPKNKPAEQRKRAAPRRAKKRLGKNENGQ
jgi:hypothetical protein